MRKRVKANRIINNNRVQGDEKTESAFEITSIRYLREAQRLRGVARSNMRVPRSPLPLQFIRQFDVSINLSPPR